jgi:hypothetical protein
LNPSLVWGYYQHRIQFIRPFDFFLIRPNLLLRE